MGPGAVRLELALQHALLSEKSRHLRLLCKKRGRFGRRLAKLCTSVLLLEPVLQGRLLPSRRVELQADVLKPRKQRRREEETEERREEGA